MNLMFLFDNYLTPMSKLAWLIIFGFCISIIIIMYFMGFDDVEIYSKKFYMGIVLIIIIGTEGVALGRGLNVWYDKQNRY